MIDDNEPTTDNLDQTDDIENQESGKGKKKSGSGGGGGPRVPPNLLKDIMANWEALDASKAMARLAEFFKEMPARASAHVQVSWANLKSEGFAIINQLMGGFQQYAFVGDFDPSQDPSRRRGTGGGGSSGGSGGGAEKPVTKQPGQVNPQRQQVAASTTTGVTGVTGVPATPVAAPPKVAPTPKPSGSGS